MRHLAKQLFDQMVIVRIELYVVNHRRQGLSLDSSLSI